MAESKETMARLERLERDSSDLKRSLVKISAILSDHGERFDRIEAVLVDHSVRIDKLGDRLADRLDRLIAVTVQERTYSVERLADIERRLSKIEQRLDG